MRENGKCEKKRIESEFSAMYKKLKGRLLSGIFLQLM